MSRSTGGRSASGAIGDWSLCARCGLVSGHARVEDAATHDTATFLCDDCAKRVDQLGDAATALAHTLMRWARDQEWRGVDADVLLEAAGLSFALFEARLMDESPLSDSPQLLHAIRLEAGLELTVASGPKAVWCESFGTWDSPAQRVPFLIQTEGSVGPRDVVLHYWDKRERSTGSLDFWTADEQVLSDLCEATEARRWGVPWNVVEVGGLKESSAGAVDELSEIVGALGFFPATGGRDAARGTATIELAGDLNESARELLVEKIARSFACDAGLVKIRSGRYSA